MKQKVYYIKDKYGHGYWTERVEDFISDLSEISEDEEYRISCKELTIKEYCFSTKVYSNRRKEKLKLVEMDLSPKDDSL